MYSPCFPPQENNFFAAILGVSHAGLSEEPLKAFITNAVAWILQRPFQLRIGNRSFTYRVDRNKKRDVMWAAGIIAVAVWALLHIPLACYDLLSVTIAFITGIILFFLLVRTRDLRLVIVIHALYDLFVPWHIPL
jgi:membrane protease YdiL (CAAX protease family)